MNVNEFIKEYIIPLDELGEVILAFNEVYHNPTIRNIDNFIKLGGDPNQKHSNNRSLLHRLVRVGSLREIEHFLDIEDIDVNVKAPFEWARFRNHEIVREARNNDPDSLFSTPLDNVYAYYQALKISEDNALTEDERNLAAKRLSGLRGNDLVVRGRGDDRRLNDGDIVTRTEDQLLQIAELLLSQGGEFIRFNGDEGAQQFLSEVNNLYDPDDPTEKFKREVMLDHSARYSRMGQIRDGESSIDRIKDLINYDGVDVNTTIDPSGNTALHYTILQVPPNFELAQTLIDELDADIYATNNDDKTALDLAWELYEQNYNFENGTTLSDFEAFYNNSLSAELSQEQRYVVQSIFDAHQIIKLLVLRSDPDSLPEGLDEEWFNSEDNFDDADLDLLLINQVNALMPDTNRIRELIDEGANPNAETVTGQPILYTAVLRGEHEVVEALIDNDANPLIPVSLPESDSMSGQRDISLLELINMQFNSILNTDPNDYRIQQDGEDGDEYEERINYYDNLRKSVNHLLCAVDNEDIPDGLFLQCGGEEPSYTPPQQENSQELFNLFFEMTSSDDTIEELTDSQLAQIRGLIDRDSTILNATQDGTGLTALHLATMTLSEQLVNLLLEYEFDLDQIAESSNPAYNGKTALDIALNLEKQILEVEDDGGAIQDELQYTINKLERIINSLVCSGATPPDKSYLYCRKDLKRFKSLDEPVANEKISILKAPGMGVGETSYKPCYTITNENECCNSIDSRTDGPWGGSPCIWNEKGWEGGDRNKCEPTKWVMERGGGQESINETSCPDPLYEMETEEILTNDIEKKYSEKHVSILDGDQYIPVKVEKLK